MPLADVLRPITRLSRYLPPSTEVPVSVAHQAALHQTLLAERAVLRGRATVRRVNDINNNDVDNLSHSC